MLKIVILFFLILLAVDGIFRDGYLIEVFLGHEMHLPFFIRIAYIVVAIVSTALLFHAVVWEFNLMPKLEEKKTPLQIKRDEEEEARLKAEEEEAAEAERIKQEEEMAEIALKVAQKEEEERVSNEGRKYLL
ncbi:MAG: hypothetical protein FWG98_00980 [Candidatus Cloacimonetes bacterium]|nr:hypothetical protein [Candidatus Cloacimonadota bacterium]